MTIQTLAKAIVSLLFLITLSTIANANDRDHWIVRLRSIDVAPNDSSGDIAVNGISVSGSGVGIDEDIVPEIDFTYMLTKHIGLELILATSNHSVTARGSLGTLGKVINTDVLPPTLTLQYHFNPEGTIRPYAGFGVNYTLFYDEKVRGSLDVSGSDIHLNSSWGLAAQLGIDYMLNNEWFINADIKYIKINSTASFHDTVFGNVKVDVDIDPIIVGFGFGKRF